MRPDVVHVPNGMEYHKNVINIPDISCQPDLLSRCSGPAWRMKCLELTYNE